MKTLWQATQVPVADGIVASIVVYEQQQPHYAMVLEVTMSVYKTLVLHLTKARMAKALESALTSESMDPIIRQWLTNGRPTPSREKLAQWFLSRVRLVWHQNQPQVVLVDEIDQQKHKEEEEEEDALPPYEDTNDEILPSYEQEIEFEQDQGDQHMAPDIQLIEPPPINKPAHPPVNRPTQTAVNRPAIQAFEPASVRMRTMELKSEWTDDCRHVQLELTKSKRDIQQLETLKKKTEAVAAIRRQQIIATRKQKLLQHDQKRRESRMVKQSIADTLEYHDILRHLEAQLQQTKISSIKQQHQLTQTMRIAIGRSEKWKKGPVLGPGPVSQMELRALEPPEPMEKFVYDRHGRKHRRTKADELTDQSVLESAMNRLQRLLHKTNGVLLFRQYDRNRSRTLDRSEFQQLLHDQHVVLSEHQFELLFQHFDPNGSGAIDYGELLWGFLNRQAFLKRWQQKKTRLSTREIKQLFYQYDRTGRGALSPKDFQLAMDDLGFQLSEHDLQLLCLRFDTNHDGFLDYNEFHAFVNDDVNEKEEKKVSEATSERDRILRELEQLKRMRSQLSELLPPAPVPKKIMK